MDKFTTTFKSEFVVFGKPENGSKLQICKKDLTVTLTAKTSTEMSLGSLLIKDSYSNFSVKIPAEMHEILFGKVVPARGLGKTNDFNDYSELPKTWSSRSLDALTKKIMEIAYDAQFQTQLAEVFDSPKFIVFNVKAESGEIHSNYNGVKYGNKATIGLSYAVMHFFNNRFYTLDGRFVRDAIGDTIPWSEESEKSIKNAVEELTGVVDRVKSFKSKLIANG